MKKQLIYFFLLCFPLISFSQAAPPEEEKSLVNWMTLEEAMQKNQVQPKPILLDFYTSWCGWCKVMMKTTYSDTALAQYINKFFYPVKFDAEGKDTVEFLGKKYGPTGKEPKSPHELAVKLLQGKLMYPTTIFMNDFDKTKNEFKINLAAPGYLDTKKIEPLLIFTLENVYKNCSYDDFREKYEETYYDSTVATRHQRLVYKLPNVSFASPLPKSKKTLVFIYTDWCNACRVMKSTSFIDSTVFDYMQEKFELVDFNAEYPDSVFFKNHVFKNQRTPQQPFHEMVMALTKNNLTLPSLAILNENLDLIDVIPFYVHPKFLNDILHFYGDEINMKKSWQEFMTDKEKSPRLR